MVSVAVWSAPSGGTPSRLVPSAPDTEADLENWVRADPSLVRDGLVVVAQQLVFASRERLDLLCIESRSRWLVVELKRDRLAREVAAQALDYVSLLASLSADELLNRLGPHLALASEDVRELVKELLDSESEESPREIAAAVVGVSADEPLLRITRFLTEQYQVPISVVELQAFQSPSGDRLILREETGSDAEVGTAVDSPKPSLSVDDRWARVHESAAERGFGPALAEVQGILQTAPVYLRPYRLSVMIAPPSNRTRYLGVIGFSGSGGLADISYGVDALQEFYPGLSADEVLAVLGPAKLKASPEHVVEFAQRLERLLRGWQERQQPTE